MGRFFWRLVFILVRNWPSGYFKPFPWGAHIRRFAASRMLDHCGEGVNIERGCHIGSGKNIRLGDRSAIGIRAEVYPFVTIGSDVMMGPEVLLITENHAIDDMSVPMNQQGYREPRPIVVEDDVWIGQRAIILPGVTLGRGSVIGAGAVVAKSIPPFSIAVGNPARPIRSRCRSQESLHSVSTDESVQSK